MATNEELQKKILEQLTANKDGPAPQDKLKLDPVTVSCGSQNVTLSMFCVRQMTGHAATFLSKGQLLFESEPVALPTYFVEPALTACPAES